MTLIPNESSLSIEVSLKQARDHRDEIVQMTEQISKMPVEWPNPFALAAGIELLRRSAELANSVLASDHMDRTLLIHLTNQLYEVRNSFPLFLNAAGAKPATFPSRKAKPE